MPGLKVLQKAIKIIFLVDSDKIHDDLKVICVDGILDRNIEPNVL